MKKLLMLSVLLVSVLFTNAQPPAVDTLPIGIDNKEYQIITPTTQMVATDFSGYYLFSAVILIAFILLIKTYENSLRKAS